MTPIWSLKTMRLMEMLDLVAINQNSPYVVLFDGTSYVFDTCNGARIAVAFAPQQTVAFLNGYWLGIENQNGIPTLSDKNVRKTVFCILEEFFHNNPDYLLYICEYKDDRQEIRNRMFRSWFNSYEYKERFFFMSKQTKYQDNETYVSLIVAKNNYMYDEIKGFFDEVVELFNRDKP